MSKYSNKKEQLESKLVHPGETLRETLAGSAMTQKELSKRLGITKKTVNQIINGKNAVTPETAVGLERVFGVSADFWNQYQKNYDQTKSELNALKQAKKEAENLDPFMAVYRELAHHGLVGKTRIRYQKVQNLWNFFAVDSLESVAATEAVAFRQSTAGTIDQQALAAWLRWGEIESKKRSLEQSFNRKRLRSYVDKFRKLTRQPVKDFKEKLQQLCAECGVILEYTPYLSRTYVDGATRWVNQDKPLIQISQRNKSVDIFWFTFFHEVGHLILHGKKDKFVEFEKGKQQNGKKEDEADAFAQRSLLEQKALKQFIDKKDVSASAIKRFAANQGVSPAIVAGQVAHQLEGETSKNVWKEFSSLRTKLEFE